MEGFELAAEDEKAAAAKRAQIQMLMHHLANWQKSDGKYYGDKGAGIWQDPNSIQTPPNPAMPLPQKPVGLPPSHPAPQQQPIPPGLLPAQPSQQPQQVPPPATPYPSTQQGIMQMLQQILGGLTK